MVHVGRKSAGEKSTQKKKAGEGLVLGVHYGTEEVWSLLTADLRAAFHFTNKDLS